MIFTAKQNKFGNKYTKWNQGLPFRLEGGSKGEKVNFHKLNTHTLIVLPHRFADLEWKVVNDVAQWEALHAWSIDKWFCIIFYCYCYLKQCVFSHMAFRNSGHKLSKNHFSVWLMAHSWQQALNDITHIPFKPIVFLEWSVNVYGLWCTVQCDVMVTILSLYVYRQRVVWKRSVCACVLCDFDLNQAVEMEKTSTTLWKRWH